MWSELSFLYLDQSSACESIESSVGDQEKRPPLLTIYLAIVINRVSNRKSATFDFA